MVVDPMLSVVLRPHQREVRQCCHLLRNTQTCLPETDLKFIQVIEFKDKYLHL